MTKTYYIKSSIFFRVKLYLDGVVLWRQGKKGEIIVKTEHRTIQKIIETQILKP